MFRGNQTETPKRKKIFSTIALSVGLLSGSTMGISSALADTSNSNDLVNALKWYYGQRTGGGTIPVGAYQAAWNQAMALQSLGTQNSSVTNSVYGSVYYNQWTSLGPAPVLNEPNIDPFYPTTTLQAASGRVTSMAFASDGTCYIGTADGGVWKKAPGSSTWTPLTDNMPTPFTMAIGAITVDQATNTVYAGTGEDNYSDSIYGMGLVKSTDGGTTWTTLGQSVFAGQGIKQITVSSQDSKVILVAASNGLWRSSDGGTTWSNVIANAVNATAVIQDPNTPTRWYATIADNGNSANPGINGLYVSSDNGLSWSQETIANGLPASDSTFDNTALAAAPDPQNPGNTILWASISNAYGDLTGLFYSLDSGNTWGSTPGIPDYMNQSSYYHSGTAAQGTYDNTIAIDPKNPYRVIVGGIGLFEMDFTSPGNTKTIPLTDKFNIHPDQHALAFNPVDGKLYVGNDGGVWSISGDYTSATNLNTNLAITQFYPGMSVSQNGSLILAGAQDNGTVTGTVYNSQPWTEVSGGDGTYTAIDPWNPGYVYTTYPQGYIMHVPLNNPTAATEVDPWVNGPTGPKNAGWVVPFVADPAHPGTLLAGYEDVYKTTDYGNTWAPVTTVGANNSNLVVNALTLAPSDSNVIYAAWSNPYGSSQSLIEASYDGGATWTSLGTVSGWVTSLTVDPTDAHKLYATMSGYWFTTSAPAHVLVNADTTASNAPANWQDITGDLPNAPVNTLLIDGKQLIVGTDLGVFGSTDGGTHWEGVGKGLPTVAVVDLKLLGDGSLVAATHGRSIWVSAPLHSTSVSSVVYDGNGFNAGPLSGGTVTISGAGFTGATQVLFGQTPATSYTVLTDGQIQATAPALTKPQTVNVQVITPNGTNAVAPGAEYSYVQRLAFTPGQLTLPAGSTTPFSGVLDDVYGQPVAGKNVSITLNGGGAFQSGPTTGTDVSTTTDSQGLFGGTFTAPTTPGTVTVTATVYGSSIFTAVPITVTPADPHNIILTSNATYVNAGGGELSLNGLVTDSYGNPVPGTNVALAVNGPGSVLNPTITTDAQGRFSTNFLAPNSDALTSITATDGLATSQELQIHTILGTPASVTVSVTPSGVYTSGSVTVSGTVLDSNSNPVANATVYLASDNGLTLPTSVTTDAKGKFSADFTAPTTTGNYPIVASTTGQTGLVTGITSLSVSSPPVTGGGGGGGGGSTGGTGGAGGAGGSGGGILSGGGTGGSTGGAGGAGGTGGSGGAGGAGGAGGGIFSGGGGSTGGSIGGSTGGTTGGSSGTGSSTSPTLPTPTVITTQKVDATGGTTSIHLGTGHINIFVPPGAFAQPEDMTITTGTVQTLSQTTQGISSQTVSLVFGVHFSGTVPTKPVVVTLYDPTIPSDGVVYKLSANGQLIPVHATVRNGQAVISFSSDPDFVVLAVKPGQRVLTVAGHASVVPAVVTKDGQVPTTYMPIWYVGELLKNLGVTGAWDGRNWHLTTSQSVNLTQVQPGHGSMSIYLNGKLVQNLNGITATDPSTGEPTTYMPIWYVMNVLKRLGLKSAWDGQTWSVTR